MILLILINWQLPLNFAPSGLQSSLPLPDFFSLVNGLYLLATPLCNGYCPIMDPITEMGVVHTVGLWQVPHWEVPENVSFISS